MKHFADNADYFDALKRIASYDSIEYLRRNSEKTYGLQFEEALEMSYDNIRNEATRAVRGKRRPKNATSGARNVGDVSPQATQKDRKETT